MRAKTLVDWHWGDPYTLPAGSEIDVDPTATVQIGDEQRYEVDIVCSDGITRRAAMREDEFEILVQSQ